MANEIQVFESNMFGKIRTVEYDGKVLFCGSDVAKALGYIIPSKAVNAHCKGVSKMEVPTNGGNQNMLFITEGDVYRLITHSKLPAAEQFESWVFDDIMPTIRKTGGYINNPDMMVNTYFSNVDDNQKYLIKSMFDNILAQQKQITSLSTKNEALITDRLIWADRNLINALVRKYARACDGNFGVAWNEFKKELLYKYGININSRITAYLNKTGKITKPKTLDMITDDEVQDALKTIVSMCENKHIDTADLLENHKRQSAI